ncbi:M24 family metallopeptidase [Pseudemcibacter aquimaris]|uniref:M24 family metallopeptidase n=1 Tax=Pseudemcibacter aquimaris TaxID=2857064 RepID=UPI00201140B0|nr:Xaa-Pro peptidase family protein [Pseudemcibacter aquimaris]MCC3862417.1 Xaa-Pro peptidase family protein [Pseudemcibacter aquimaris]WDU59153.1 Xaa-Pro peptidase family protein [Pseudemcibacter aquimaris]
MKNDRRSFLKMSTAAGAGLALSATSGLVAPASAKVKVNATPIDKLQNMMGGVEPITLQERMNRIEKAKRLMRENNIDAIYLEGSSNLEYFTGVTWGRSERMMAAIIPQKGEVKYICPMFEADRLREKIIFGDDVRGWEEHESPYKHVAQMFKDMGINNGTIGIGERTRFFLFDGIRKEAPHLTFVSADPVTIPCRLYKSKHELALLQKANDITIEAYKTSVSMIEAGMTAPDIRDITRAAHAKMGVYGTIYAQVGIVSSSPHGLLVEPEVEDGIIVLMDGGCTVHGYESDISRTFVHGTHTDEQKRVWDLERKAQQAGFEAAQLGAPLENVDIAARKVITDAGYGPEYKTPGLPHRTGHGIGLDGHEWGNAVLGNKTPLAPGMCFSIEPMIAIPGKFGVRLEDVCYMTEDGPRWFTQPSVAIDDPFGNN